MMFYVKRADGKIEGIYSSQEVLHQLSQQQLNENDLLIESKGQSSFQLKSSEEWAPIKTQMSLLEREASNTSNNERGELSVPSSKGSPAEADNHFKTLSGYGMFLSGFGWFVIVLGIVMVIALSNKLGLGGSIILCAVSVLSGIGFVVSGQVVSCFVAIEKNTRTTNELLKNLKR